MIKFCFIVLHFNEKSLEDTFECVDSIIMNILSNDYKVVIVENGSCDSSEDRLKSRYIDQNKVDIVLSKTNQGFAKGNNIGCTHAMNSYNPEFLIVLNNDIVIEQYDILSLIVSEYDKKSFHVLGPDIIDLNGNHQNPITGHIIETISEIEKEIILTENLLQKIQEKKILQTIKYYLIGKLVLLRPLRKIWKKIRKSKDKAYKKDLSGAPLHGSAIIFSKDYLDKYGGEVFYPHTFLYAEEDILYYIAKRDKLKLRYLPKIKVFHKEDSSTNSLVPKKLEKDIFTNTHKLNSLYAFKELVEKDTIWNKEKE